LKIGEWRTEFHIGFWNWDFGVEVLAGVGNSHWIDHLDRMLGEQVLAASNSKSH
jgi:hypothetical protein